MRPTDGRPGPPLSSTRLMTSLLGKKKKQKRNHRHEFILLGNLTLVTGRTNADDGPLTVSHPSSPLRSFVSLYARHVAAWHLESGTNKNRHSILKKRNERQAKSRDPPLPLCHTHYFHRPSAGNRVI